MGGGREREREGREKWRKRIWTGKEIEKKGIEVRGVIRYVACGEVKRSSGVSDGGEKYVQKRIERK